MRWKTARRSENVEDRRRVSPGGLAIGGGGAIIVLLIAMFFGADAGKLMQMLQGGAQQQQQRQADAPLSPEEQELGEFVSVVLADTEDVWNRLFREMGAQYREPTLVLFTGQVRSACGMSTAAVGPFYCPADSKLYIDLSFYDDLKRKHQAPGDFAQAYVIAHEVGHHVQNLLGITDKVHSRKGQIGEVAYNDLSVRLELQADFFAGVWAHHAHKMRQMLEEGDIKEALNAATAIGDDRLQMQGRGYVRPETFTHGTSEQRVSWFRKGLVSGDMSEGDTFGARDL